MAKDYGDQKVRIARGLKENIPDFEEGELGLTLDEGNLYVEGKDGKIKINNQISQQNQTARNNHTTPKFVPYENNPIITGTDIDWMDNNNIGISPGTVLNAEAILGNDALDTYYFYVAADHGDETETGISLLTAPHPTGDWTHEGKIFEDTNSNRNESPAVVYNPEDDNFHMYYRVGGYESEVKLATSPNGYDNWTIEKTVLPTDFQDPYNDTDWDADGHFGYCDVWREGENWLMRTLISGGDYPYYAIAYSKDGYDWFIDPNLSIIDAHLTEDFGLTQRTSPEQQIYWKNQKYWLVARSPYESGPEGQTDREAFITPYSSFEKINKIHRVFHSGLIDDDWILQDGEKDISAFKIYNFNGLLYLFFRSRGPELNGIGVAVQEVE